MKIQREKARSRRGSALVYAVLIVIALSGLVMSLVAVSVAAKKEQGAAQASMRALYVADSGLSDAFVELTQGLDGQVGDEANPVGFGKSSYWVDSTPLGSFHWSLVSTGKSAKGETQLELIARIVPSGFFQYGAYGDDGVLLNSNATVDSFNSTDGTYASQVPAGGDHANDNGNVGSNADVTMEANSTIYGSAIPGPAGILDDDAPVTVATGYTTPAPSTTAFPPITVPVIPSSGNVSSSGDITLPPGDYHYDSAQVNAGDVLHLVGPMRIVLDAFDLRANGTLVIDATAGEVEIYGTGDFVLRSNSSVNTLASSALDVSLFLSGNNQVAPGDTIQFNSNADFMGTIYAPNAHITLQSNFTLYGAVVADYVELASNAVIHYDEALALGEDQSDLTVESVYWHPVTVD